MTRHFKIVSIAGLLLAWDLLVILWWPFVALRFDAPAWMFRWFGYTVAALPLWTVIGLTLGLLFWTCNYIFMERSLPTIEGFQYRPFYLVFILLSFIGVSSLHQFAPIGVLLGNTVPWAGTVDYIGFGVFWSGVVAISILIFKKGNPKLDFWVLLFLGVLCLLPSDKCENQFNYTWVYRMGSSPIMYLPVLFSIQCAVWGLSGKYSKWQLISQSAILFASIFLGLGHYFRFIW